MADVWFVRHAPTTWTGWRYCGRSDPPLSEAGTELARRLAIALRVGLPAGLRVVSSPRMRAVQTARTIADAMSVPGVEIDDRWAEADFGAAEGFTFDELAAAMPRIADRLLAADFEIDWPDGETAMALRTRVETAWQDLVAQAGPVLVVSHAGPLRIATQLASLADGPTVATLDPAGAWRTDAFRVETATGATIPR